MRRPLPTADYRLPTGINRKLLNSELNRLTPDAFRKTLKMPVVVILDNIRSQHNIGAAFRTADAFCIEKIILCGICAVPPSAEIHKTALGAEDTVAWEYAADAVAAITQLQQAGYIAVAVEQAERRTLLHAFSPQTDAKYALIFGNEVQGVQQQAVDACDDCLEIPQFGTKHSLNVSVSIGIVLWDFRTKWKL
ncbi:MAG: TrmH family RNA methyltransferase [Prevotellaceae bacterium]|jgi:tRNA G18 (ribose-2'-O)-methylase SpoU|nr:TrmH family RNA methyltransferase [Prevotellaceae bacterium]